MNELTFIGTKNGTKNGTHTDAPSADRNETTQQALLQSGKQVRPRTRAGALLVTLGLTVTVVATPAASPKAATAGTGTHRTYAPVSHAGEPLIKGPWQQIGKASWYGGQFNGRKTATGERFDMHALTCAHRTLPLGTWVRVTNLINHRFTFLRVNDRGPMARSLILDLSYGAAQKLGISGLGKVKIDVVTPGNPELAQAMVAQLHMPKDPLPVSARQDNHALPVVASSK